MASVEEANSQVRRIAILVTSLDATAGRQLLMAMPSELAREVRRAMTRLTHVDPEEQRQVLAEFRSRAIATSPSQTASASNSTASAPSNSAATPTHGNSKTNQPQYATSGGSSDSTHTGNASARAQATSTDDSITGYSHDALDQPSRSSHANSSQRPWQRFDVATLTKLLRGERATVIAVVLSQLDPKQAAALLEQLPRAQHREVIGSLATLGQIDPDAMAAIDDYLASRIADYQHRDSAESETVGRLQMLLSAAPASLKADWEDIISDSDAQLAHRMGIQYRAFTPLAAAANVAASASTNSTSVSATAASTSTPSNSSTSRSTPSTSTISKSTSNSTNSNSTNTNSQPAVGTHVSSTAETTRVTRGSNGNNLSHLLANNVVTTVDTQMAGASQAVDDDEPRVLPFPNLASQTGHAQPNATLAARPVIAARQTSADDKHRYPEVVLAPRGGSNSSTASPNVGKSGKDAPRNNLSTLARFEHLLDLPAEMIGQTLAECETEVVLLALAGATPAFMQRFMSMLERHDARALKARIRELGPIHLNDVDEAQRRICEVAIRIVGAAEREQTAQATLTHARAA